jgi:hypothetical protein
VYNSLLYNDHFDRVFGPIRAVLAEIEALKKLNSLDQLSGPIDKLLNPQNSYEFCNKNIGFVSDFGLGFGLRHLHGLLDLLNRPIDRLLDLQKSYNFNNLDFFLRPIYTSISARSE